MERRRELSTVLTVCVALMALCGPAHAQYGGGTGDPNNPYLIHTPEQMNAIGANPDHWGKHFKLMADIDLSAYTGEEFNIIGRITIRGGRSFTGVFDGNDHTITSFTLSSDDKRYGGLFECVGGSQAEICNLGLLRPHVDVPIGHSAGALVGCLDEGALVNCHVVGGAVSGHHNIGGLVGVNQAGTIDNCYAATTVNGTNYVGGLVGENHSDTVIACHGEGHASGYDSVGGLLGINYGTVTNCDATGTVDGRTYTGGLVGYNDHGTLSECHATGGVTGSDNTGGLLGFNWEGTVTACHTTGDVTGTDCTGGLSGCNWGGTLTQCYVSGRVDGADRTGGLTGYSRYSAVASCYARGTVTGEGMVGGLIGWCLGGDYTTIDIDNSYATADTSGKVSVGGLVGSFHGRRIANCYAAGIVMGTDHVGGLIGQWSDGEILSSFWDIESSGQTESAGGVGLTTVEMKTAETFLGWGGWGSAPIWTIDEGNDYPRLWWERRTGDFPEIPSLSSLLEGEGTCNDPFLIYTADEFRLIGFNRCAWDSHFKLMADIDLGAYASDQLRIIGLDFYRGSFAGVFDGNGHSISNFHYVAPDGGYVGLFGYVAGPDAEIRNLGLVTPVVDGGTASYTGLLVGYLLEGMVRNCFIDGGSICGNGVVGGLVGRNLDHITSCYVTGTVCGNEEVGGLAGRNSSVVAYCYSTSRVTGISQVGGLVGNNCGRIVDCYSTETGSTTTEMQDPNVFASAGWDFLGPSDGPSDIWAIDGSTGYPILWWQVPEDERPSLPSFSGGTGTMADPYQITTGEQLIRIGHNPGLMAAHFQLANSIDLADVSYIPIGSEGLPFTGGFDGNGKTVSNCAVSMTCNYRGLFGYVRGTEAIVKNLGLIDVGIDVGGGDYVGALVGSLRYGTVSQCHVLGGRISGNDWLGGLVGHSGEGTIADCAVMNSRVVGSEYVGGLVGESQSGTIVNSTSDGSVTGYAYAGGLAGENEGTVTGCHATGTVVGGYRYTGGLAGRNRGTMAHCDSAGITTGIDYVGGLVGYNSDVLTECSSTSEVHGVERVGGLAGYNGNRGQIGNCCAAGTVSGGEDIGGLVGHNIASGTIANCYATSTVSGDVRVGGLVGQNGHVDSNTNRWSAICYCYSTGYVSGQRDVGGLVGWDAWGLAESSFWDVEASGQASSAGGTGLTTGEMQTATPFIEAGWDFVGEAENGTEDLWWIDEGQDYPRLWWELLDDDSL